MSTKFETLQTPNTMNNSNSISYLVTTQINRIPTDRQIIMIDGTTPGWQPRSQDLHWDHHRPGGDPIQLTEIPLAAIAHKRIAIDSAVTIVTTQVDADACVAAAAIVLAVQGSIADYDWNKRKLAAIAWDCDHLVVPAEYQDLEEFAAKAVAGLKQNSEQVIQELRLPADRKKWSAEQREEYASRSFQEGTIALVQACLGQRLFPGEMGEADKYWEKQNAYQPIVFDNCRLIGDVAVFDQRCIEDYVDPRLFKRWINQNTKASFSLTYRDGSRMPILPQGWDREVFSYTLAAENNSDLTAIFPLLQEAEDKKRSLNGIPPCVTQWGGRAKVGGSSWNDAMIVNPQEVIEHLNQITRMP